MINGEEYLRYAKANNSWNYAKRDASILSFVGEKVLPLFYFSFFSNFSLPEHPIYKDELINKLFVVLEFKSLFRPFMYELTIFFDIKTLIPIQNMFYLTENKYTLSPLYNVFIDVTIIYS